MGKDNDERAAAGRVGRVRGLHDIRTPTSLRRVPLRARPLAAVNVQLGIAKPRPRPAAELPAERPRTWVFVGRPRFARYQAMLLVDPIAEPDVEVFEEEQGLMVLAALPGVREAEVDVQVNGDVLILSTRSTPDRPRYYRELLLPFAVSPDDVQRAFRNGVLEMEFGRASPTLREIPRRRQP